MENTTFRNFTKNTMCHGLKKLKVLSYHLHSFVINNMTTKQIIFGLTSLA